jgi:polyhydroxyalkanoate synthesis regulator phasin
MDIIVWIIIFVIFGLAVFYILSVNKKNRKLLETVTKTYRGTYSERNLVLMLLKYGIPSQTIFHDLYVKKSNGNFSQIDLVVATKVGIIIFEVKDYSGWLFGKGYQNQWTQVLAYGREKYRFYNPVMQNNGHITALKKQLKQFENIPFYSVIVFYGNCELKDVSFIPQGTFLTYSERVMDVINTILNKNEPANYSDKYEIINVLKEAVQNGENIEIQNKHIKNVRNMLDKDRIFE